MYRLACTADGCADRILELTSCSIKKWAPPSAKMRFGDGTNWLLRAEGVVEVQTGRGPAESVWKRDRRLVRLGMDLSGLEAQIAAQP